MTTVYRVRASARLIRRFGERCRARKLNPAALVRGLMRSVVEADDAANCPVCGSVSYSADWSLLEVCG